MIGQVKARVGRHVNLSLLPRPNMVPKTDEWASKDGNVKWEICQVHLFIPPSANQKDMAPKLDNPRTIFLKAIKVFFCLFILDGTNKIK